jgi:hypothetical protein
MGLYRMELFIAENAILSKRHLIEQLDEEIIAPYTAASTIATASLRCVCSLHAGSNLAVFSSTNVVKGSAPAVNMAVLDGDDDWSHSSLAGTAQVSNSVALETGKLKVVPF